MKGSLFGFYWSYDDGTTQAVVVDPHADKILDTQLFLGKKMAKKYLKNAKSKYKNKNQKLQYEELDLHCGLKDRSYNAHIFPGQWNNCFQQVQRFIQSCGQDEKAMTTMIKLFSGILCGFCSEALLCLDPPVDHPNILLRAPVIVIKEDAGLHSVMREIISTLCMNNKYSDKELKMKAPSLLPYTGAENHIEQNAFLLLRKVDAKDIDEEKDNDIFENNYRNILQITAGMNEEHDKKKQSPTYYEISFPAQYRDTSVMLNVKYYRPSECIDFQRRNPWATIILYGAKTNHILDDYLSLDPNILNRCDLDSWNSKLLSDTLVMFQKWLADNLSGLKETILKGSNLVRADIRRFNESRRQSGKIRGLQGEWLKIQIISLFLFAKFILEKGVDRGTVYKQMTILINLLLPGYYPGADVEKGLPLEQRTVVKLDRDSREIFEKTIAKILEDGFPDHIQYKSEKDKTKLIFSKTKCWGVLRKMRRIKSPVLIFPWSTFVEIAPTYSPVDCDWDEVIKAVENKAPGYLHRIKNNRCYSGSASVRAITLYIDKMTFLSRSMLDSMNAFFSEG